MAREIATRILLKLIADRKPLSSLKPDFNRINPKDRSLVKELCYGVARWYFRLAFIADRYLTKALKVKDTDVYILILLGIYQLLFTRIPTHAAINETVNTARALNKEWATRLINGILRKVDRERGAVEAAIDQSEVALYAHPDWLIKKIQYWKHWAAILEANNRHPLQCLRVNQQKLSRIDYLERLKKENIPAEVIPYTKNGLYLVEPLDVEQLPLFHQGGVSIQDGSAQLAAELLNPLAGEYILDACAAPGGKTCHLLELQPKLKELVALDNSPDRLHKIADNLTRLDLTATLLCQDITHVNFWQGELFDRILLDVPCSATGVINRQPDIKLLRTAVDIPTLTSIQATALKNVWNYLKPEGVLLYVTCSVLPEENEEVILEFIRRTPDAQELIIEASWGLKSSVGRQVLPGMYPGMDGFYFAKLKKKAS